MLTTHTIKIWTDAQGRVHRETVRIVTEIQRVLSPMAVHLQFMRKKRKRDAAT